MFQGGEIPQHYSGDDGKAVGFQRRIAATFTDWIKRAPTIANDEPSNALGAGYMGFLKGFNLTNIHLTY